MSEPANNRMVWMDRINYYADGRKETRSECVPDSWCKHDDGDCHKDDPCENCPVYRRAD
jgi:hypothetical protein